MSAELRSALAPTPGTTHRSRIVELENGESWVPLPDEVLAIAGVSEGDEMILEINDGEIKLRKAP